MEKKDNIEPNKEQLIVLSNKTNLSVSGTNKIISLKPDLIQLSTVYGDLIIVGNDLELIKLDNSSTRCEISGNINELKYVQSKNKESVFRKIFKWFFKHKIK